MKLLRDFLAFILAMTFIIVGIQNSYGVDNYTNTSILNASGKWIKIKVEENAIYRLTYEDLQSWGLNPAKTKIYGYGGWILNEYFSTQVYIDDLPEVATWVSGADNKLEQGEFLLFYGRGTVKWSYNTSTKEYVHENNPYSTYGVYFLTDAVSGEPKRMETKTSEITASTILTSYEDYKLHEKDEYSIAKTGRELYGESFTGKNTQEFPFWIPGIMNNNGLVSFSFASKLSGTKVSLNINGDANIFEVAVDPATSSYSTAVAFDRIKQIWSGNKNENTIVRVSHPCENNGPAYLNYIRLNMLRKLEYYGELENKAYTFFRNSENLTKNVQYDIQTTNQNLLIFDVTGNYDTKRIQTTSSDNILSFKSESGELKEFVMVDSNSNRFSKPEKISDVVSQNLHGLGQIDMVIISPKAFVSEAERLAQAHRDGFRKLKVVVVTPELIYNEFSSGTPDATAYRRFMKMFYDRGTNDNDRPKYLLLFGDGMFDNRFLDPSTKSFNKDNFLLTYQVKESLKTDESYTCDDYFGLLDEKEEKDARGLYQSYGAQKIKLGIGRFPIQSISQAKNSVDKVLSYMDNKNRGIWKNSLVFVADDSDSTDPNSSFTLHMKQADSIAYNVIQKNYPEYMLTKIYMDAFKPENVGGRKSFDIARKKFFNALNEGCLTVDYTGHGGSTGLADGILSLADISTLNYKNLPLWITATCDFAIFDGITSTAGENLFLSNSGAIALFTSTRVVYAQDNLKLNFALTQNLFARKSDGSRPTLGDVMKEAKNSIAPNNNKMNYILLGDPALTLNYPEYRIEIQSINEQLTGGSPVTLKALESVEVSGIVKNKSGQIDSNFNGFLMVNVFDGIQTVPTVTIALDKEKKPLYPSYYTDYPNLIAPTYCNVVNGKFKFDFSVMRDIADTKNLAKMNLYASGTSSNVDVEAQGSFMNYNIYGTADNEINDNLSPEILSIYLNDETFGPENNIVNPTPNFVAKVSDELGINMSGAGIGHNIQLIIDNLSSKTYNLNGFYKASTTQKNTGTITYSIPALSEGEHTLTFRVWNILNNVSIRTFKFIVKNIQSRAYDLTVNSNPAKIGTTGISFGFSHNQPEVRIEVNVNVFDLSGRLVWSHKESGSPELISAYEIPWNLKNNEGENIQPGVYVYSASVKGESGIETTKAKKMIVVGQ